MIDKIKTILTITIVVVVVAVLGYSIVKGILNATEEADLIIPEEIVIYTKPSNIVTNYTTYYYLENCLQNFMIACDKEMYNEIYDLYINDYAKSIGRTEAIKKIKKISSKLEISENAANYRLLSAYAVDTHNSLYILEISIAEEVIYMLFDVSAIKGNAYAYAFLN